MLTNVKYLSVIRISPFLKRRQLYQLSIVGVCRSSVSVLTIARVLAFRFEVSLVKSMFQMMVDSPLLLLSILLSLGIFLLSCLASCGYSAPKICFPLKKKDCYAAWFFGLLFCYIGLPVAGESKDLVSRDVELKPVYVVVFEAYDSPMGSCGCF